MDKRELVNILNELIDEFYKNYKKNVMELDLMLKRANNSLLNKRDLLDDLGRVFTIQYFVLKHVADRLEVDIKLIPKISIQ